MAYTSINLGTANQGDGDSLRTGGGLINTAFGEVYAKFGTGSSTGATLCTGISCDTSVVTLTSPVINTGISGSAIKDEDNMSSDSATHLATQQSIKAYVDAVTFGGLSDVTLTSPTDAALLLYDTGTSKWRDATMSGDIGITDTGATTIQAGVVDSGKLASASTLLIKDSGGSTVKTIIGAGS